MAFITVDDRTGRQEIAVFSEQYREHKDLLVKDNLVVVEGEVSHDEFTNGYKMRCMEIMSLERARMKSAKYLKIMISQCELTENFSNKLMKIFKPHQDEIGCPVRVVYQRDESYVTLRLGENWRVKLEQSLLDSLKVMEEIENVDVAY